MEPTPKDILPIPYFAFELNAWHWIAFMLLAGLAGFALQMAARRRRTRLIKLDIIASVRDEIRRAKALIATGEPTSIKSAAFSLSLKLRRFLSAREGREFVSCSERDLQHLLQSGEIKRERGLVVTLLQLEALKYSDRPPIEILSVAVREIENEIDSPHLRSENRR